MNSFSRHLKKYYFNRCSRKRLANLFTSNGIFKKENNGVREFVLKLTNEKNALMNENTELFKLWRIRDARAALEFIRSHVTSQEKKHGEPLWNEPIDKMLKKISGQEKFKRSLEETCELNKVSINAIQKCICGLYHTASKPLHGYDGNNIIISAKDWVENEIIALGLLFKYYSIPFVYKDKMGDSKNFPYKIVVK
ncbi:6713_t:CDS:2 [Diversispora eburnea]|uniref:6713_t:CDS:1 n=1 Tax=Diversispora eburnea TaxID=1213867 RepID=A0A9N9BEG4_9GLOM|nr:6713_t:CDS:2 [Diversispora eburnea]